jgi:hypothetical protein
MFMMGEYVACVLLVLALSALVFIVCGVGYLLKGASEIVMSAFRNKACRVRSKAVGEESNAITDYGHDDFNPSYRSLSD